MQDNRTRYVLNNGVCASAGRRLMALAKAIPPPTPDLGSFPRTPNREHLSSPDPAAAGRPSRTTGPCPAAAGGATGQWTGQRSGAISPDPAAVGRQDNRTLPGSGRRSDRAVDGATFRRNQPRPGGSRAAGQPAPGWIAAAVLQQSIAVHRCRQRGDRAGRRDIALQRLYATS